MPVGNPPCLVPPLLLLPLPLSSAHRTTRLPCPAAHRHRPRLRLRRSPRPRRPCSPAGRPVGAAQRRASLVPRCARTSAERAPAVASPPTRPAVRLVLPARACWCRFRLRHRRPPAWYVGVPRSKMSTLRLYQRFPPHRPPLSASHRQRTPAARRPARCWSLPRRSCSVSCWAWTPGPRSPAARRCWTSPARRPPAAAAPNATAASTGTGPTGRTLAR